MALTRREISKDVVQQALEAAITTGGHVAAIVFDASRKITSELGGFATEVFEIVEASKVAGDDATPGTKE